MFVSHCRSLKKPPREQRYFMDSRSPRLARLTVVANRPMANCTVPLTKFFQMNRVSAIRLFDLRPSSLKEGNRSAELSLSTGTIASLPWISIAAQSMLLNR